MKKILFATVAILAILVSCQNKSKNEPISLEEELGFVPKSSFVATITNGHQNAPKTDGMTPMTHINNNNWLIWNEGDEIKINGETLITNYKGGTDSTVTFYSENTVNLHTDGFYHAFYPASIQTDDANPDKGFLPASQVYDPANAFIPMYAKSDNNELTFHNICAVVKIIVPLATADKVVITANENLYGSFTIENDKAVLEDSTSGDKNSVEATNVNNECFLPGDTVMITIPAGTYTGFEIKFMNGSNVEWTTGAATNPVTFKRNYIGKLSLVNAFKGLLPGKFKVDNNKFVHFTAGNAWCDYSNSTATMHIESSQAARYPNLNEQMYPSHITHFAWGDDLSKSISGGSSPLDAYFFCRESNPIQVDGISDLYCLKRQEWLNIKDNYHAVKGQTIDGRIYVIISPSTKTSAYIPNCTTIADYTEAGCVCLAEEGWTDGDAHAGALTISTTGAPTASARYWAGDDLGTFASNKYAYIQQFNTDKTIYSGGTATQSNRGRCLRLVKNVAP